MAHLHRAAATLRIVGSELDPDEVSRLLGSAPSQCERAGEEVKSEHGLAPRVARNGVWRLKASVTQPENLDVQVKELLDQLTTDISVWTSLARRYRVDLFCGWFMKETNEGVDIAPQTLAELGSRGIKLSLDIYSADDRA